MLHLQGVCFRLFTRRDFEAMKPYTPPEMLRSPLEEVMLKIKVIAPEADLMNYLSDALEPPSQAALVDARSVLVNLGALNPEDASLTPLGLRLAAIPAHPSIGKMIIYGAIFRCLDPVLTVAASLGTRDPLLYPIDKRKAVRNVRRQLAGNLASDQLAIVLAFNAFCSQPHSKRTSFCTANFLSSSTLSIIEVASALHCRMHVQ